MTNEQPKKKSALLSIGQLRTFEGHPFKVLDDEEMDTLTESIREQGILSPLIVRPLENGEYEVISGHRRLHAAEKAGLTEVPALIYPLSREEAAISEPKANQREKISFKVDELRAFFPKSYTPKDIYNAILKMILEQMKVREQQERKARKRTSREGR